MRKAMPVTWLSPQYSENFFWPIWMFHETDERLEDVSHSWLKSVRNRRQLTTPHRLSSEEETVMKHSTVWLWNVYSINASYCFNIFIYIQLSQAMAHVYRACKAEAYPSSINDLQSSVIICGRMHVFWKTCRETCGFVKWSQRNM